MLYYNINKEINLNRKSSEKVDFHDGLWPLSLS